MPNVGDIGIYQGSGVWASGVLGGTGGAALPASSYFMPYPYPFAAVTTGGLGLSANQLGLWRFYLPCTLSVNKAVLEIVNPVNTEKIGVTLYNAGGSAKVLDCTFTSGAAGAIVNVAPSGAPVAVPAGVYLLGVSNTNISLTYRCQALNAAYINIQNNQAASLIFATGANSSAAGVNPTATGALSSSVAINFPLITFVT